jgi:hypothetical protein
MMLTHARRKDVYGHLEQLTQPDGFLGDAAAFPVNRYLISPGKGHAAVHKHHGH